MAAGPGYVVAFTDQDVRKIAQCEKVALTYLADYRGGFDPLVKAKQSVEAGNRLSVRQVRIVLNCLRHYSDALKYMPDPDALRVKRKRRNNRIKRCEDANPHYQHHVGWEDGVAQSCPGIPWKINRGDQYTRAATIKYPFAVGRTGRLVHRTTGRGEVWWSPERHGWGFSNSVLSVKVVCKSPSWIKSPVLFKEEPVHLYVQEDDVLTVSRCSNCFAGDES